MKTIIQISMIIFFTLTFTQCTDENGFPIDLNNTTINLMGDADGNVYGTVTIGEQTWMAQNLKTTSFNDGTPITEYEFGDNWNEGGQTFPFYQWADTNDLNNNIEEELPFDYYGALYNEAAITSGKLAPEGWRIPTEEDIIELTNYIANDGHAGNEGMALKSVSGWSSSVGNGIDAYGFNALPSGYASAFGTATGAGLIGNIATTAQNEATQTRSVVAFYENTLALNNNSTLLGAGIRLIKE